MAEDGGWRSDRQTDRQTGDGAERFNIQRPHFHRLPDRHAAGDPLLLNLWSLACLITGKKEPAVRLFQVRETD